MRPTKEQLAALVSAEEDRLLEHKLEGVGSFEFRKAIVAFANSTRGDEFAVLQIGVAPGGDVRGVGNADKLQRTLRNIAEKECYPPISIELDTLSLPEGTVVVVLVPTSNTRPHFAGRAFVRKGSESVEASDRIYTDLLLSQNDVRGYLLDHVTDLWTVEVVGKGVGENRPPRNPDAFTSFDGRIVEITAFYVRFDQVGSGITFTEMLQDIHISYDDAKHRPRVVIWPTGRGRSAT